MNKNMLNTLINYNKLIKELDRIYHNYAKSCKISDTTLWILYSIQENPTPYTQKEFCEIWFYSKQTVNTALKKLERQNLIKLTPSSNNKKEKTISLTNSGMELLKNTVNPLIKAEINAFSKFDKNDLELFLKLTEKHLSFLQTEIKKISTTL